ncbi:replication endonuclease [Pseudomonas sichuanensis]|uniref:replication endonuclease n=1 Tax=Pseudomonas sichuanensis TaxID=2213015 RepID=UPI00244D1397|nr:replication endonuclease [Pseudomonas sichuanensis]MDH0730278.1 replication endonuclease [Pseudomonas sichuanensis]MDH1582336.1 replication endonuclease [Pseudomonas sichuanensis]MDH1591733.1 replication endonuclease [Pseudomonas sichuanensis]MDH1599530.1 replication endonuclease [Pseudomonas sichuanensis]
MLPSSTKQITSHTPAHPWQQPKLLGSLSNSAVTGVALSFVRYLRSAIRGIENKHSAARKSLRSRAIKECSKAEAFDFANFEEYALNLQGHDEAAIRESRAEVRAIETLITEEIAANPHFKVGPQNCPPSVQLSYMLDVSFIKRRLKKICHRERLRKEAITKSVGGIQPTSYCSDETLGFIRDGDMRNELFLKNRHIIVKKTGQAICLLDLYKNKSKNKFNESYFIVKNLEAIAKEQGFLPFMLTLTAPPKFHPNPLKGKCAFDAYSTIDSQKYLRNEWARFRAYLAKVGIPMSLQSLFGLRTAELHRDGCVHWHLILFIKPDIIEQFQTALDKRFSSTQADNKPIDGCSASTYALKYILKSVDLDEIPIEFKESDKNVDMLRKDSDLSTISDGARVRAGIRAMSIRQVQYYGLNSSLTKFRILNKITEPTESFPERVATILEACRINPRNGNPKNILAYKNFLENHNEDLELIYEDSVNKHGLAGKKAIGIRFTSADYEYITKDKYQVVKAPVPDQQVEAAKLSNSEISFTGKPVTLISIYPRRAKLTALKKLARPNASDLLKQAKLLNPERYMTTYLATEATKASLKNLSSAQISKLMSMT